MQIPPLVVTAEYALPFGNLPWTIGGSIGFRTESWSGLNAQYLGISLRGAYHFALDVPHLDVYAAANLGSIIYLGDAQKAAAAQSPAAADNPPGSAIWIGAMAGVRYFFTWDSPAGIYLEAGFDSFYFVTAGATFRL
jgi:hypothetical protein